MAVSVLSSEHAVEVSIYTVQAFMMLRQTLHAHKELSRELEGLERKLQTDDKQIVTLFNILR